MTAEPDLVEMIEAALRAEGLTLGNTVVTATRDVPREMVLEAYERAARTFIAVHLALKGDVDD